GVRNGEGDPNLVPTNTALTDNQSPIYSGLGRSIRQKYGYSHHQPLFSSRHKRFIELTFAQPAEVERGNSIHRGIVPASSKNVDASTSALQRTTPPGVSLGPNSHHSPFSIGARPSRPCGLTQPPNPGPPHGNYSACLFADQPPRLTSPVPEALERGAAA